MQATTVDPNQFAQDLFRRLPRHYDLLEELLSLGQNGRWRREMMAHVAEREPTSILDVATGTAGVALALIRRSEADVTGIDITEAMLRRGRERVNQAGASGRVRLLVGQAERLPFPDESFDALTFTYLLRYVVDPADDAARARSCSPPWGGDRKSGVLGPCQSVLAVLVVALHARRATGCGVSHRWS